MQQSRWLHIGLAAVAGLAVLFGAIEWNARRSAAAQMRELMRPATPQEQAALDAAFEDQMARMMVPTPEEEGLRRSVFVEHHERPRPARNERIPVRADQRCISGQLFDRVANGWVQSGTC